MAILAFAVPLFAVLYWLTIPSGSWPVVAAAQVLVTVLSLVVVLAFHRTTIWVDKAGVTERGFFGWTASVTPDGIGSVVILDLYQSGALDTHPQLFITDRDGRLLLRMRGEFWSHADMEIVAHELAAPVTRVAEPMTLRELGRVRPELLYWFERRPLGRSS